MEAQERLSTQKPLLLQVWKAFVVSAIVAVPASIIGHALGWVMLGFDTTILAFPVFVVVGCAGMMCSTVLIFFLNRLCPEDPMKWSLVYTVLVFILLGGAWVLDGLGLLPAGFSIFSLLNQMIWDGTGFPLLLGLVATIAIGVGIPNGWLVWRVSRALGF